MSGLEILGIAASILQIADLGATVSVKLCTFYRQLKAADESAQSLSSEVALTCSILRQLGENLKADETTRLYSAQAFETAQEVLRECEKVFKRISSAVDESRGDATKSAIQRAARRLGFVLMERELDVLRGNLERLKSTMLLLLNVIMYAGQVRSRAESSVLQEQRDLIRVLVEEKKASERRLDQLVKGLDSLDVNHSEGSAVHDTLPPYESLAEEDALRELRTYHQLVKRLLQEVDACMSGLDRSRYVRIRNSVVRVHASEVERFQQAHGAMAALLFEDPLFRLAPGPEVQEAQNPEDLRERAERGRREARAWMRRVEEDARRNRRLSAGSNESDRLPLQPSGFVDPYDLQIEHSPTESRASDRMNVYPPHSRAAGGYAPRPTGAVVDIEHDARNKSTNRRGYKSRSQRQEDTTMVDIEWEDETIRPRRPLPQAGAPRKRPLPQASASAPREAAARRQRDYDLLADQRVLEKNDARQDLELMKQQAEIGRLEQVLARLRGEHRNEGTTEVISPSTRPDGIRQQITHIARQQQSAPMSVIRQSDIYEVDVDAIPVPATKTEKEDKEAVDAVDDLLLKWTTLGQDDLLA